MCSECCSSVYDIPLQVDLSKTQAILLSIKHLPAWMLLSGQSSIQWHKLVFPGKEISSIMLGPLIILLNVSSVKKNLFNNIFNKYTEPWTYEGFCLIKASSQWEPTLGKKSPKLISISFFFFFLKESFFLGNLLFRLQELSLTRLNKRLWIYNTW